jgi:Fanconi-associated nuclease 1
MLLRRLARLEKKLRVPFDECHRCEGKLLESKHVYVEGIRIWKKADSLSVESSGSMTLSTPELVNKAWGPLLPQSTKIERVSASPLKGKNSVMTEVLVCDTAFFLKKKKHLS